MVRVTLLVSEAGPSSATGRRTTSCQPGRLCNRARANRSDTSAYSGPPNLRPHTRFSAGVWLLRTSERPLRESRCEPRSDLEKEYSEPSIDLGGSSVLPSGTAAPRPVPAVSGQATVWSQSHGQPHARRRTGASGGPADAHYGGVMTKGASGYTYGGVRTSAVGLHGRRRKAAADGFIRSHHEASSRFRWTARRKFTSHEYMSHEYMRRERRGYPVASFHNAASTGSDGTARRAHRPASAPATDSPHGSKNSAAFPQLITIRSAQVRVCQEKPEQSESHGKMWPLVPEIRCGRRRNFGVYCGVFLEPGPPGRLLGIAALVRNQDAR